MSSNVRARIAVVALVLGMGLTMAVSSAQAAPEFGFEKFFAANCNASGEKCGEGAAEPTKAEVEAKKEAFRTAGGYPNFGTTDFIVKTVEIEPGVKAPVESIKNLRVDVAPGVVTNPQAVPYCSKKDFEGKLLEPEKGLYSEPACPASSVIGVNKVKTLFPIGGGKFIDAPLEGKVYNLEQPNGLGSYFGVAIEVAAKVVSHTYIEGNVEWASDYHDYFEIHGVTPGLIESRLVFKGRENEAKEPTGFIRNPTSCNPPGAATTTTVSAESYGGASASRPYEAPVGTIECEAENFGPSLALTPETAISDQPDGLAVEAAVVHPAPPATDVSDLETAETTLPEGLTMNPAAAKGLEGCTPEQIGIGTRNAVTCPSRSQIGTVRLEVPTLPPGSLQGPIFLGKPAGKSIEGPPYTIYLDAESTRYGVKVRLKGVVKPDLATGRIKTIFSENPEAPFDKAVLRFFGGGSAPLANPLTCSTANTNNVFTPFAAGVGVAASETPFTTEGCASSPPPFNWTQATSAVPATAGASSTVNLTLERNDGEQYVAGLRNVLPAGLVGLIPTVTLCGEPAAGEGTCTSASQIGTVTVGAGAGGEPFHFPGRVYLTGPYEGAPYGLSIVVPAVAGPFNLGNVIARAKIEVDPHTGQVIATDAKVPTIVGGVPTRQKSISFTIDRQGFERNPTSCSGLSTVTTLNSTLGSTDAIPPTPFVDEGCEKLAFTPSFSASSSSKTSKLNGAGLTVKVTQPPGQANIRTSVTVLPKALPSRLTTLQKSCLAAVFAANPLGCSPEATVGSAEVVTPVLPTPLKGPAIFVSHGGEEFPDLDLVVEGSGVRIILTGKTNITNGITTTTFASTPDAPVSSFTVNLPTGPHSALTNNGSLCANPLVMPTTITAQNGKTFKQNTKIAVSGCGVQIVGHKVVGRTAYLTVRTFTGGRISGAGSFLSTVYKRVSHATNATTLKIPLSPAGRRHRPLTTTVRVGFVPSNHSAHSTASVRLRFH